jgi:hypothetical protein
VQPAAFLLPKGNAVRELTGPIGLVVLDVSDIQQRKPVPHVSVVGRLEWAQASVPQNSFSMTVKGKPYLAEFDEFRDYQSGAVGAARIIDRATRAIWRSSLTCVSRSTSSSTTTS